MNAEVKMSMMLCSGLEVAEQEKAERLDATLACEFIRAGRVVRVCQGRTIGVSREIEFIGPDGTVASVPATDFVRADDNQAVTMVLAAMQQSC